jgi:type IV pilus assembly protein PilA
MHLLGGQLAGIVVATSLPKALEASLTWMRLKLQPAGRLPDHPKELLDMKTIQKGFTLIELMIVIAIIGILAAIAIPAYQNYIIRSQVTEGLSLADSWKTAVGEFFANYGSFPTGSTTTGSSTTIAMQAASSGKYVSSIAVAASGQVVITYAGAAANAKLNNGGNNILTLQPGLSNNNDVVWFCGLATTGQAGLSVAPVATGTTIPAQYLPSTCHN